MIASCPPGLAIARIFQPDIAHSATKISHRPARLIPVRPLRHKAQAVQPLLLDDRLGMEAFPVRGRRRIADGHQQPVRSAGPEHHAKMFIVEQDLPRAYRPARKIRLQGIKEASSFLKKRSKRLLFPARWRIDPGHGPDRGNSGEIKVFWFFFSKKNFFLAYSQFSWR